MLSTQKLFSSSFSHFLFILVALFPISKKSLGQNLVPNPGFEEYLTKPPYSAAGVNESVNWFRPVETTSDFFHRQYIRDSGVPQNFRGYQEPASGDGYAGIITGPGAWEYLAVELTRPLEADSLYQIGFKLSLSDACKLTSDDLGLSFLIKNPLDIEDIKKEVVFHFKNPEGQFITDTLGWTSLQGFYLAQGGEKYLIIGNFYSNLDTDLQLFNTAEGVPPWAYFFIDDVFVKSCAFTAPYGKLERDTVKCKGQRIQLSGLPNAETYYWVGIDARPSIVVETPGAYLVNNYDECDNLVQLTYNVQSQECNCSFQIPSVQYAGNPLQVLPDLNVQSYELEFYDAGGRLIIKSSDTDLANFQLPPYSAIYFWKAKMSCIGDNDLPFQKIQGGKVIIKNW